MPDSREGRGVGGPWRRTLLALAAFPLALSLMAVAAPSTPTPTPTPTDTPTPTPTPTGTLTITKTDPSGQAIPVAGVTFEVRDTPLVGTPGPAIQVKTRSDGVATAQGLELGRRYCVKELTAPAGYRLAPTFTPTSGCNTATGAILAADPLATPTPTPSDTPSPTPSPTAPPTGELQITKTDPSGRTITAPGFTFNIHVGSAGGQVIATISTDGSGMAVAGALNPATYCVEEISAPDGYQVAPTYSPAACVNVASDSTQGHAPTLVTVIDPPAPTPTPSTSVAGSDVPPPSPSATPRARPVVAQPPASPAAALARGLVGLGALLLLAGAIMIVVAIRRRRPPPAEAPPSDYWYDSTIG